MVHAGASPVHLLHRWWQSGCENLVANSCHDPCDVVFLQFLGPYSVSKTALLGLIKAMAPQCGQKNIRVNGIAPGIIRTNFSSAVSC